jgi:hypothetical protein
MRKFLIKHGMQGVLKLLAFVARRPGFSAATGRLVNGMARATIRGKGLRRATTLEELGDQWQRGFPARKQVPITAISGTTVLAEIHTPCPLRGSGDLQACHRMMGYDRAVARHAGGQFLVLRSQAEAGRTHCQVALRWADADVSDLVQAHQRPATR